MKYYYLVAYWHSQGYGRCFVTRDDLITSQEQVEQLESNIESMPRNKAIDSVSIMSFQLLRKEK